MIEMRMNQSTEDYLEAILMIREEKGICRSIDVANKLEFKKSSVSIAISKLVKEELVIKEETGEIKLTSKGDKIARSMLERHNFFKDWLLQLGVDEETAYKDACRMEHAISDESFEKIKNYIEEK